jgi:hypothetical protein
MGIMLQCQYLKVAQKLIKIQVVIVLSSPEAWGCDMFKFEIIENEGIWSKTISHFNNPDCYYSYQYGNLFARKEEGSLLSAYYEDREGKVFYPFIRRKVPYIEEDIFDIVTPYGYGGPLIDGDLEIVEKFYKEFTIYCKSQSIITETIRFHPMYENHHFYKKLMEVSFIRQTTAVDLSASLEDIRKQYSSMNKRNIKKAQNQALTCFVAENKQENIRIFMDLYKETMDRNSAVTYYYFDEDYFSNQLKETDLSNTFLLFTKLGHEIIAGVMVLIGEEFSHYHLGASRTNFLGMKPNNVLFDYMIEFCKLKGSKLLHLGGGYRKDDGLFKFKTSFTNHNNYNYYMGRKIHNPELYKEIIERLKEQYHLNDHYFPIYRGQIKDKKVHI